MAQTPRRGMAFLLRRKGSLQSQISFSLYIFHSLKKKIELKETIKQVLNFCDRREPIRRRFNESPLPNTLVFGNEGG